MNQERTLRFAVLVCCVIGGALSPTVGVCEEVIGVESSSFHGRLHDNVANQHRQGSGFNPLVFKPYAGKNLFRDDAVGVNFEHIFNGSQADNVIAMFTPRQDTCVLEMTGPSQYQLSWPAAGSQWGVDATMAFDLSRESQLDLDFQCKLTVDKFPQGYVAMMWASYMQSAVDRQIRFWGQDAGRKGWLAFGEGEGVAIETGTVDSVGVEPLPFEQGAQALNIGAHPHKKFIAPFYYGLLDGDQDLATTDDRLLFLVLFDQTEAIRFAMWNFFTNDEDEPDTHSPAWDWQYVIREPEVGKTYGYRARIVVKPFEGVQQVASEYRRWQADLKVELPPLD